MGFEPNGWGSVWTKYMNSKAFISTVVDSLVGFRDKMARLDFIDPHLTVEPSPTVHAAVGVDDQGLVVGVKTLPCSCPQRFWAEPDASLVCCLLFVVSLSCLSMGFFSRACLLFS